MRDYQSEQHGRVGEFLLERGVILGEAIEEAVHRRRAPAAVVGRA